jgi:hypothetical protein
MPITELIILMVLVAVASMLLGYIIAWALDTFWGWRL